MRKLAIISLPVLALAAAAAWLTLRHSDPIAGAKQRMARQDMRGAELYLRQALRHDPNSAEAAYLLGRVDLSLGNPQAAELELKRAQQRNYPYSAIVPPLGQAYLQQRHFDAILREFDPVRAAAPDRAAILIIRAAAQLALGDAVAAAVSAGQAEALEPASRDVMLTAARIALARDDLDGAAERAARVLAHEPGQADALLLQSEVAMRRNDAKTALARAQAVLAGSPGRLDARMMEARSLAALDRPQAARASIEQVLRGAPRNVGANYLSAMLATQAGDYASADTALTAISSVVDRLPRGLYFVAVAKLGLGQSAQAEEAATKFLSRSPDDTAGLKLLAFIDLARHRPAAALALLQQGTLATQHDADTLDLIGRAQAMSGDMQAATTSFGQATKLAPADTAILNRLAAAQLNLGNTAAAEADFKRSLDIAPKQRLAGEAIVQAALARGDIEAANRDVDRLRRALGDGEEAGVLAAQVKLASLDFGGAETTLRDLLRRFPDSRPATLNLVRTLSLQNNQPGAQALLASWLQQHPGDGAALDLLLPGLINADIERAIATAEAAHTAAPDDTNIVAALAATYARAHQASRAVALLDRASAETKPQLDLLRAHLLADDGKAAQAEQAYRGTLRQDPGNVRARIDLAALLSKGKRFEDARTVLREGLVQSPGNPALLEALVGTSLREGGIRAALTSATALRADPQNLPAAATLAGDAWEGAGDTRQAAAAYLTADKATPSGPLAVRAATALSGIGSADQAIALLSSWTAGHPQDSTAQSMLGSLLISAHRYAEADQRLSAVLAGGRANTTTLNNLAWVKEQLGDMSQAKLLAERAYFLSPAPEVADTLGWILARQGDLAHALPLLAQAAGTEPIAAYHFGWALNAAGRKDEARAQLQKATESQGDFAERPDAQRLLLTLR